MSTITNGTLVQDVGEGGFVIFALVNNLMRDPVIQWTTHQIVNMRSATDKKHDSQTGEIKGASAADYFEKLKMLVEKEGEHCAVVPSKYHLPLLTQQRAHAASPRLLERHCPSPP